MSSLALQDVSPNAEIVSKTQALRVNTAAAVGLQKVLQSNLGPTGTLKLLVGGSLEQLKLTKDGSVLLKEMQIQHPTAALIARTASAQDAVTGDGTTSIVLLVGELLRVAEQLMSAGGNLHPRHIVDGYEVALKAALDFLETQFKVPIKGDNKEEGDSTSGLPFPVKHRDILLQTARTSLSTKLDVGLVEKLSGAVVDAITCVYQHDPDTNGGKPIDLNLVEKLTIPRHAASDSRLVKGLVLDHGGRHPDMPHRLTDCYVLTLNVSLEYEQAETSAGFVYSTAEEREKLVESERIWLDERCRKIVQLKRTVCDDSSSSNGAKSFVIINQKGVDPLSLDMFAKEGILCLRRAKRRNMERLVLAAGGEIVQSLEDLSPTVLGRAGSVTQVEFDGDDTKYTFVEDCPNAKSCTLLLHGPNQLTLDQLKDAIQDGLRSVKNTIEDGAVVPGAGAFEIAASEHLRRNVLPTVKGKVQLGVSGFADALEVIPKTLAANSGADVSDVLLELKQERAESGLAVGWNCRTNTLVIPSEEGIWDNVRVKRQGLHLAVVLANQLLLVDEVMRAGKQMGRAPNAGHDDM